MMSASEIRSLTGLSRDARQAVAGAFKALAQWREEVLAANERCLEKAVAQTAAAQRALGWPEHVTEAAAESLQKAAKVQTHSIDQIMEALERQLKSPDDAGGVPKAFGSTMPAFPRGPLADPVAEMMRMGEMALVPFKLWMRAAEAWQRNWATAVSARTEPSQAGPVGKAGGSARRPRPRAARASRK